MLDHPFLRLGLRGRDVHRPGRRADRLRGGAAGPGVHRGRPLPCGLHRRPGRPGLRDRPPGRACTGPAWPSPSSWPLLGRRASADDSVIGSVFAWILGLGALFLSIFTTAQSGSGGAGGDAGRQRPVRLHPGPVVVPGRRRRRSWPWSWPAPWSSSAGPWSSPAWTRPWPAARGVPVRLLGLRLLRAVGRDRRRGHPGGGRPAAAGTAGRAGRRQPAAHRPALRRPCGCRPASPSSPCGAG